jgi:hypothetical protein
MLVIIVAMVAIAPIIAFFGSVIVGIAVVVAIMMFLLVSRAIAAVWIV